MLSPSIQYSVTKTAVDSLYAKWSAVAAGYEPITSENNGKLYKDIVCSIAEAHVDYKPQRNNKLHKNEQLQSSQKKEVRVRRQTPLVNAGYSFRVAAITGCIVRYIQSHCITRNVSDGDENHEFQGKSSSERKSMINVVMIGCGLDALGLWALSLSPSQIQLFEIDCKENCDLKMHIMEQMGILKICSNCSQTKRSNSSERVNKKSNKHNENYVAKGWIDFDAVSLKNNYKTNFVGGSNYTLMSGDLCDIMSIKEAFNSSSIDTTLPTVVISELVLAYLDTSHGTNLLKFIASDICCSETSLFLALEPIGGQNHNNLPLENNISVTQGYTADFFKRFSSKLNRGNNNAALSSDCKPDVSLFQPLGFSCIHAQNKLRQCGFDGPVDCCLMPKIIRSSDTACIKSPELFDEHAALLLHMQCYGISCAAPLKFNVAKFREIFPWTNDDITRDIGYWHETTAFSSNGIEFKVSAIKTAEEQKEVRRLFQDTYCGVFEEFPSVKKMVKTALKSDLNDKAHGVTCCEDTLSCSAIWNRYSRRGGAFWVVSEVQKSCKSGPKIIGCAGVTRCSNTDSHKMHVYELHRLAIDLNVRGQGIGSVLLRTVEDFIMLMESGSLCALIATTPACMEAANKLYSSNGFDMQKEVQMGKMMMRTFQKKLQKM